MWCPLYFPKDFRRLVTPAPSRWYAIASSKKALPPAFSFEVNMITWILVFIFLAFCLIDAIVFFRKAVQSPYYFNYRKWYWIAFPGGGILAYLTLRKLEAK